jgi:hypothetical protein
MEDVFDVRGVTFRTTVFIYGELICLCFFDLYLSVVSQRESGNALCTSRGSTSLCIGGNGIEDPGRVLRDPRGPHVGMSVRSIMRCWWHPSATPYNDERELCA